MSARSGQWWNSRAPVSPPNGCWFCAASCAAAPGVAVTWALPGVWCTLTSAEAIGASPIAAAETAIASGATKRSCMVFPLYLGDIAYMPRRRLKIRPSARVAPAVHQNSRSTQILVLQQTAVVTADTQPDPAASWNALRNTGNGSVASRAMVLCGVIAWLRMALRHKPSRPLSEHWSAPDGPLAAAGSRVLRSASSGRQDRRRTSPPVRPSNRARQRRLRCQ